MPEIIHRGQDVTGILSGNIRLETGNNRLVIYNGAQELTVVDETGFDFTNPDGSSIHIGISDTGTYGITYYDTSGNVVSVNDGSTETKYSSTGSIVSIDSGNKTVYYDATNPRIVIGKSPDDGRIGIWISKVGQNVITNLGG